MSKDGDAILKNFIALFDDATDEATLLYGELDPDFVCSEKLYTKCEAKVKTFLTVLEKYGKHCEEKREKAASNSETPTDSDDVGREETGPRPHSIDFDFLILYLLHMSTPDSPLGLDQFETVAADFEPRTTRRSLNALMHTWKHGDAKGNKKWAEFSDVRFRTITPLGIQHMNELKPYLSEAARQKMMKSIEVVLNRKVHI